MKQRVKNVPEICRNKKKSIRAMTGVTWLLITAVFGIWVISMGCLTLILAQEIYDQLYVYSNDFASYVSEHSKLEEFYDKNHSKYRYQYENPDYLKYRMWEAIAMTKEVGVYSGGHYNNEDREKLIRDVSYPMKSAVLFYDLDGKLLHSSDENVMYFSYYTQEEWNAGADTSSGIHYGWIDIQAEGDREEWQKNLYTSFAAAQSKENRIHLKYPVIRVKGYFEGNELIPAVMHYVTDTEIERVVESNEQFCTGTDSYSYQLSDVDRTGQIDWQIQFDCSNEFAGEELETIYLVHTEMWNFEEEPVYYHGVEYESLVSLTKVLDLPLNEDNTFREKNIYKLNDLLIFGRWGGAGFSMVTAIRSNPLACAMSGLRNIYLWTGAFALVFLLMVRSRMKRCLVKPMKEVINSINDDWCNLSLAEDDSYMWSEAQELYKFYEEEKDWRLMKKNEITRLGIALQYAKEAEQSRRQMTSNIAHELKTPLAVIHSYAEGLKANIAEEKREKYLNVILAEAEKSDAMVLEMLDLSRLEAGKVKLSRDEFSMNELVKATFQRLELVIQDKNLAVTFDMPEECIVTGDEGRIAQVIENFASNAVKYTPESGRIQVKISVRPFDTTFSIANDSKLFSAEELSKVWEAFYRVDESRSSAGTGLGLTIAKSIIDLHGGTCAVRNIDTGVEFSFSIK